MDTPRCSNRSSKIPRESESLDVHPKKGRLLYNRSGQNPPSNGQWYFCQPIKTIFFHLKTRAWTDLFFDYPRFRKKSRRATLQAADPLKVYCEYIRFSASSRRSNQLHLKAANRTVLGKCHGRVRCLFKSTLVLFQALRAHFFLNVSNNQCKFREQFIHCFSSIQHGRRRKYEMD